MIITHIHVLTCTLIQSQLWIAEISYITVLKRNDCPYDLHRLTKPAFMNNCKSLLIELALE